MALKRVCLPRAGRSSCWCWAVVAVGVLMAASGCSGQVGRHRAPTAGDPGRVYAAPGGALLRSALLTGFGDARPVRFFLHGSDSVLIAPVFANPAGFKKAGWSEIPVRDQECRPWLSGLLWAAARNPALGRTAAAAFTIIGGEYTNPGSPPRSPADLPAIWVHEVVVAAPSEAVAAGMIPPAEVPVQCQHTVSPVLRGPSTGSPAWRPTQISPAGAVRAGDQAQAETIVQEGNSLPPLWSETFRMRNFDVELDVRIAHSVQQKRIVLKRLVQAAYVRARAALLGTCGPSETAGSSDRCRN
jgi:hypothetical protein